jgi:hypothetical protein
VFLSSQCAHLQESKQPCTDLFNMNNSPLSCDYCSQKFTGRKAQSALNRHLRTKAKKIDKQHPALDSDEYLVLSKKFKPRTKDEEEKRRRILESNRKWAEQISKRTADKVRDAFILLK